MIEVEVEDDAWTRDLADAPAIVQRAAEATLKRGAEAGDATLTLLLTDDETVRGLNARFRGKDAATNVLSFPAPPTAPYHLGDVALAHGVCAREALNQGKSLAAHLSHLVVHAVLHLLGHDHEAEAEAEAMEGLERAVLARLGIADPYRLDEVHARS